MNDVNLKIKYMKLGIMAEVKAFVRRERKICFQVNCVRDKSQVNETEKGGYVLSFIRMISRDSMQGAERRSFAKSAKFPEIAILSFRIVVTSMVDSG